MHLEIPILSIFGKILYTPHYIQYQVQLYTKELASYDLQLSTHKPSTNQGQTKGKPKEPRYGVTEVQTHGEAPQTNENKCPDVEKFKVNI